MIIGDKEIKTPVMLAPMAGFSDRGMRLLASMHGCDLAVTEMISAKAVVYGDRKTRTLAKIGKDEGTVALQIFGSEPSIMAEAAARLSLPIDDGAAPAFIDVNMGCPVNKIFSNSEGSALMRSPRLIEDIVSQISKATDTPCSVKLRLGVDEQHVNVVECALAAEAGGAAFVAVHARTREGMYHSAVNFDYVRDTVRALSIPVIANGDIRCAEDAVRVLSHTGAGGVMIGRGAVGNPFVFAQIKARLNGTDFHAPAMSEYIDAALLQLRISIEQRGEKSAVLEARKQIAMYLRDFAGAARVRAMINSATTYSEVESIFLSLSASLQDTDTP